MSVAWSDDFREAGDEPEVSGVRNTIAAQEFGADFTDYYRARGAVLRFDAGVLAGARWRVSVERDREDPLGVRARPASGRFSPAFAAEPLVASRVELEARRAESAGPYGTTWRAAGTMLVSQVRFVDGARTGTDATFGRFAFTTELARPVGADLLVARASAAATVGAIVPRQAAVYFGGPQSAPGYDFHQLGTNAGASGRLEWQHRAFSFPLPLGRFGPVPMGVTIAPYVAVVWTDRPWSVMDEPGGWFPSVGVGALTFFEVLRLDVARGLRRGRWMLSVDVSRDLWRIL